MRVIKKSTLIGYWEQYPKAEDPLRAWVKNVENASWKSFAHLRETYGSADTVGDCVVFNICGNHYRLIVRMRYRPGMAYVLRFMTHAEYDRNKWPEECGCHRQPPKRRKVR